MATLTVQTVTRAGIVPTYAAAASGGDEFANDGAIWIEVHNDHATEARTVTIVTQITVDGEAVADKAVVITAANDVAKIGPWPSQYYNDGDSMTQLTYSDSAADMRVGCFTLTTS
jgi:hypothetical protein